MNYWLVKQEPNSYSFDDFTKDGKIEIDRVKVRNGTARNNLKSMKKWRQGLLLLAFLNEGKRDRRPRRPFQKNTFPDVQPLRKKAIGSRSAKPASALKNPVTLAAIKANLALKDIALVRLSRLSVVPLTKDEFDEILNRNVEIIVAR